MSAEYPSPAEPQQQATSASGGGPAIALNIGYVKSIPGILKIVQFFVLVIAFACVADTVGSWGAKSFFLFVTIVCWLLVIAVFVMFLLSVDKMIPNVNWNIVLLVNAVLWAVLLLISSALLADDTADFNAALDRTKSYLHGGYSVTYYEKLVNNLIAGVVFGFFSLILVALEGAYYLIFGVLRKG